MSTLYIFRGKAATGKTTLTDHLSKEWNIPVLRKDDVYDPLANTGLDHGQINRASFEILAQITRTNIQNSSDLILDISLAHTPHIREFLSKIPLENVKVKAFLCICSDDRIWRSRIEARIQDPTPNQLFTSVEQAEKHYQKYEIEPMEGEVNLDSALDLGELIEMVKSGSPA